MQRKIKNVTSDFSKMKIPVRSVIKYRKKIDGNSVHEFEDLISREQALQLKVKSLNSQQPFRNLAITMRSPGEDIELTIGFLFTEGIISGYDDIVEIEQVDDNVLQIVLQNQVTVDLSKVNRNFYTSSSCGICSKSDVASINYETTFLPWTSSFSMKAESIYGIKEKLASEQAVFSKTGGVHAIGLCNDKAELIEIFEDIGRHNAMDKLIGHGFLKNIIPFSTCAIIVSGRLSYELVQKAAMAGTPMLIALGAPSELAIEEACAQNICLVGFAKDHSFNVYSAFERII